MKHVKEPPVEFFTLGEVARRWRRIEITTQRLLRRFGVPVYRITSRDHLYRRTDIEEIERKSLSKPPAVALNYPALAASIAKRRKNKSPDSVPNFEGAHRP